MRPFNDRPFNVTHRVKVTRPKSHLQEWGRGARAYYSARHDLVLSPMTMPKKRLVVAKTSGAVGH